MRSRFPLLFLGLLLLFAAEITRVYLIMPFPGSQHANTIRLAYYIDANMLWLRMLGAGLALPSIVYYFDKGSPAGKTALALVLVAYGIIVYLFNFRFEADRMFSPPKEKSFATGSADTTGKNRLIIGVALHGEARAYPIEIIGFHHQVRDTLGGQPMLITYCTVCRTGRVFSPIVNGRVLSFRLVGMDHYNALFEDNLSHSWWRQATGEAITGPLKGTRLAEIPSSQMSLGDWQTIHPESMTLQPDPHFIAKYDSLRGYEDGKLRGSLERRDTASWRLKSWVVGIHLDGRGKAYDWNMLVRRRVIKDTLAGKPILLTLTSNNKTFFAFLLPDTLDLQYDPAAGLLEDRRTSSAWDLFGNCISGPQKGQQLSRIQSYQEYWHAWKTFQ